MSKKNMIYQRNKTPLLVTGLFLAGLMSLSVGAYPRVGVSASIGAGMPSQEGGSVKEIIAHLEKHGLGKKRPDSHLSNPFSKVQGRQAQSVGESDFVNSFDITSFSNKNGVVEIEGKLPDNPRAFLRLAGDKTKLQGRLTDFTNRKVYEYSTTSRGVLRRVEVPVEKYYPDLGKSWVKATNEARTLLKKKQGRIQQRFEGGREVYSDLARANHAPHIAPYVNQDLRTLQSRPNSRYVVYLDQSSILNQDGSVRRVNVAYTDRCPRNAERGDRCGEADEFINVTAADVYKVWQVVASQYSMFDVNVTTNEAAYNAASTERKIKLVYLNKGCRSNQDYGSFGQAFNQNQGQTCMDSIDNFWALGVGLTIAHELGHALNLGHDGKIGEVDANGDVDEYFDGIPAVEWTPLMGNYWPSFDWADPLFTFNRNEFTDAITYGFPDHQTNREDLAMIQQKIPRLDVPANNEKVLRIDNGQISPDVNFGQIRASNDQPVFTFNVQNNSRLNLRVEPVEIYGALDVSARLIGPNGNVIATRNPQANRRAEFTDVVLAPGNHRLEISGGAERTPQTGFSSYASLGHFAMGGTLVAVDGGGNGGNAGLNVNNIASAKSKWKQYTIDVPAGKLLTVTTTANNGDADLYVKSGSAPTTTTAIDPPLGCYKASNISNESCSIRNNDAVAKRYFIGVYAYKAFNNLQLRGVISD